MIRDAVDKAMTGFATDELREVLREIADDRGEINRRSLGKWISRKQGVIVNGMKFERASGTTSAERWQVKSVVSVSSVMSVPEPAIAKSVNGPTGHWMQ